MTYLTAFQKSLIGNNFVVLDTETTGLQAGEIVSIAIIDNHGETLLNTLVKPKNPIPADATRIHGITDEMVRDAPNWPEIARIVELKTQGKNVVVYNAVYDRRMMHQSSELWDYQEPIWKEISTYFCAMEAFAEAYGDWNEYRGSYRWQSLATAYRHVTARPWEQEHGALSDCLSTLKVVDWLLDLGDQVDYDVYGNKDISGDL